MLVRIRLALAVVLLVPAALLAQTTILLEDFSNMRTNGQGTALWAVDGNPNQVFTIENHDGSARLRGDVSTLLVSPTSGEQVNYYVTFLPVQNSPRYPHPEGFTKSYIESGSWNPNANRLEFWMKCNRSFPTSVWYSMNIGTYLKNPSDPADPQGTHYYHYFHPAVYANRWVKVEMNATPTHRLGGSPGTNWSPHPHSGGKYFDQLTRFYIAIGGNTAAAPMTCWLDDFKLFEESGEPDDKVKSITATYTGSGYEVSWDASKWSSEAYEVRYATQSMKTNGFASGTQGGTRNPPGDDYGGVVWTSPAMAESSSGMYFAIRPVNGNSFTEIYLPRYGSGASPAPPPTSDTTPPSVPQSLSATAQGSGRVNLSWNASNDTSGAVAGYRIRRCQGTTCNPTSEIGTATSTSYADTTVAPQTAYRYVVAAYDSSGNTSANSSVVSVTTPAAPQSPPPPPPPSTPPPSAGPGALQTAKGNGSGVGLTVTLPTAPTPGNLIVAMHFTGAANSLLPSGFSEAIKRTETHHADAAAIYYRVVQPGDSRSVTLRSPVDDQQAAIVFELAGPFAANPLDKVAGNAMMSGSGLYTVATGNTSATSQADEVAVALVSYRWTAPNVSSWTGGFVELAEEANVYPGATEGSKGLAAASMNLSSSGAVGTTATFAAGPTAGIGLVATFRRGTGGGTPAPAPAPPQPPSGLRILP